MVRIHNLQYINVFIVNTRRELLSGHDDIKTPLNVHENSQTDIFAKWNTSFRFHLCSFHLLRS